jgi:hypothetical protein
MLMRALVIATFGFGLAACGEEERTDCCAIEPRAKCEGDLLGNGLTHAELDVLLSGSDAVCPSEVLSEARIREIAPIWIASRSCTSTYGPGRLSALESGVCPARSLAGAPPLPAGVDLQVATTCATGLAARGLSEAELWLVLGAPGRVCPNDGVTERRLRDVIAKDWAPASCTQFTADQMLEAMNSGACGGNAGSR